MSYFLNICVAVTKRGKKRKKTNFIAEFKVKPHYEDDFITGGMGNVCCHKKSSYTPIKIIKSVFDF